MARYKRDAAAEEMFTAGSLDSLLPQNAPARGVWSTIAALDFSAFDAGYVNDVTGRLAIDPRRIAAVWIVALMRGYTSSVQLASLCSRDIEFRWLLGGACIEKSTLCTFRKDRLDSLTGLSTQVLAAMALSDLLPGESVAIDGTIVRAASSVGKNRRRKNIKRAVDRLERVVEQRLSAPEVDDAALEALAEKKQRLEDALRTMDALGLLADNDRLTLTEPEASMKKLKGNSGFAPAHNVQVVSDLDSGAIIHAEVVDAKNDAGQLAPQLEKTKETLDAVDTGPMESAAADSGYHDTRDLAALEAQDLRTFVPNERNENRSPPGVNADFTADNFLYDEGTDTFTCPAGNELRRRKETAVSTVYQARRSDCAACPHKPHCCPRTQGGRNINRSKFSDLIKTIAQRAASEAGRHAAAQRRTTAEGIFARLKTHLHWPRCRLFGRRGAQAELRWRQLAHNILLLTGHWAPLVHRPKPNAQTA